MRETKSSGGGRTLPRLRSTFDLQEKFVSCVCAKNKYAKTCGAGFFFSLEEGEKKVIWEKGEQALLLKKRGPGVPAVSGRGHRGRRRLLPARTPLLLGSDSRFARVNEPGAGRGQPASAGARAPLWAIPIKLTDPRPTATRLPFGGFVGGVCAGERGSVPCLIGWRGKFCGECAV